MRHLYELCLLTAYQIDMVEDLNTVWNYTTDYRLTMPDGSKHRVDRFDLCSAFAWAVPDQNAIDQIVKFAQNETIIEIGAGRGYWASLIKNAGGNVECWDDYSRGYSPDSQTLKMIEMSRQHGYELPDFFHPVQKGSYEVLQNYPTGKGVLFLCWPEYDTSQAHDALKNFRGDKVIFVGEGWGGCTGDEEFFNLLGEEWDERDPWIEIPQYNGIHDYMSLYTRKSYLEV